MEEEFKNRVVDSSDSETEDTTIVSKEAESDGDDGDDETQSSFLGNDPPIHGQRYALMSFANTSLDTFSKIEMQCVIEFLLWLKSNEPYGEDEKDEQAKALALLMETPDANNQSAIDDYRKRLTEEFPKYYGSFISGHRVLINEVAKKFLGKNKVERAFKVRGTFKTYKKAEDYMKQFLAKKVDDVFPIHICEVGQWKPFNPTMAQTEKADSVQKELNELLNGAIEEQRKSAMSIDIRRKSAQLQAKRAREEYYKRKEEGTLPDDQKDLDKDTIKRINRLESRIMECSLEEQEEMREDAEKEYARITKQPYRPGILARIFDRHKMLPSSVEEKKEE